MKNGTKIFVCILCAALLFSACTSASNQKDKAKNTATKTAVNENQSNLDVIWPTAYGNVDGLNLEPGSYISVIGRSGSGDFWKVIERGAQRAIDDINDRLGYTGEDKVKLAYSAPSTKDSVDEQVNILDEELALYPAAVAIAIVDSTACEVQFDLAAENNIPIIAFESGSDYEGIQAMISTNNIESAKTAAAKLCDAIKESGKILLFVHDSYSTSALKRAQGVIERIENEQPDVTVDGVYYLDQLDEIRQQIADERDAKGADITDKEVLSYILEHHPDAKGCITTDADTTQAVLTAVKAAKLNSFKMVGFEGGSKQLASLEGGDLSGLIVQNPYGMGYASVVAAARAALGLGNEAVVHCGYIWVDKDNLNTNAIQKQLY